MTELLRALRDIVWMQRGPQDVPYSPAWLAMLLVANLAVQWGLAVFCGVEQISIMQAVVEEIALLAFLYLILMTRGFANRFVQTATAFQGIIIIFTLLLAPMVVVLSANPKLVEPLTPLQSLFALLTLPIVIWKFVIDAHVFRNALSTSLGRGFLMALVWLAAQFVLNAALNAPAAPLK
jgi:hypothetical protein